MSKPHRPLRPHTRHRARYPHFGEPSRYTAWVGPLMVGSTLILTTATAAAQEEPIPETVRMRGEAVAVPTYDQRLPLEGTYNVPLTDGGYAEVAVVLSAEDPGSLERVVADAELTTTVQTALAAQDCHSIAGPEGANAVLTALRARHPQAVLSHLRVELFQCESYADPPGEPPVVMEDMPLPGAPPLPDMDPPEPPDVAPAPPVPDDEEEMPSPGEPPTPELAPPPPDTPDDPMPLGGVPRMPE